MNTKILVVAVLTSMSVNVLAHPSVELNKQQAEWADNSGAGARTPEINVTIRNKTKNKCLLSVTGRVLLKNGKGTVVGSKDIELLSEEIEQDYVNLEASEIIRRAVALTPLNANDFHYMWEKTVPSWKEGSVSIQILKVKEVPAEKCGYFPDLSEKDQETVNSCFNQYMNLPDVAVNPYRMYAIKYQLEAIELVKRTCKAAIASSIYPADMRTTLIKILEALGEACHKQGISCGIS